jgi:hypothetical protein
MNEAELRQGGGTAQVIEGPGDIPVAFAQQAIEAEITFMGGFGRAIDFGAGLRQDAFAQALQGHRVECPEEFPITFSNRSSHTSLKLAEPRPASQNATLLSIVDAA